LAKVSLSHFPVFFNCTNCAAAKWKSSSSGGGTQGGTVMRMSFFWLAALVFACAGECREQFSQRAFYLLDRLAINQFVRNMCQNTGGSEKVLVYGAKNVFLAYAQIVNMGKLNCCLLCDRTQFCRRIFWLANKEIINQARPWQPKFSRGISIFSIRFIGPP
jgi:hypothetical protein